MVSSSRISARLPFPPAIAVALALLLVVASAALWLQGVANDTVRWRAHTLRVRLELAGLRSDLLEASRAARGHVASARDDEPGRDAERRAPGRLQRLRTLTADNPAQQQRLETLGQHLHALLGPEQAVPQDAARQRIATGDVTAQLAAIKALLDALDAEELRLQTLRDAAVQHSTNLTVAGTALGSLLSLALVAWAGRGQQRSLRRLGDTVRALVQAQDSLGQANARLQAQAAHASELNQALWRTIDDGVVRPAAAPRPMALDAPERLEALRRTQLMDTPPEEEFDRFTRLAALSLHAPLCLISLVDERRQFFKSAFGLPQELAGTRELPVGESFCQFVVRDGAALVVDDAQQAPPPRYEYPPPAGVGAYLGVPLATPDGLVLGSFCIVDDKPRHWSEADRATLERIAQSVLAAVAVRMQLRALERRVAERTAEVQLLTGAIRNSLNGVAIVDAHGRLSYANDAFAHQFGHGQPQALSGVALAELCAERAVAERIVAELHAWGSCRMEITARRCDGGNFEALLDAHLAHDEGGHEVIVVTTIDITERKRAEQALRLGEERLRLALEAAHMGAYEYDAGTGEVRRTGSLYAALGLALQGRGAELIEQLHPEDRPLLLARMAALSPAQPGYATEYRLRRPDGSWAWVADQAQASFSSGGVLLRQIGINMDVTARRQAEAALQAALSEKEVLLQEVHHRVKNNLQVVSSLLQLQRRQLADPALQAVFMETEQRVRAMALVHQRLYQQSTLSALNFADYLRSLADQLVRAHGAEQRVRIELALQPVKLPVDMAVPLGLIVTELITNALKYAWAPGARGVLDLRLRAADDPGPARMVLEVRDDGVGLPPGLDPARGSGLGMRLVTLLSAQLDAAVDVAEGPGTWWRLVVPLPADAAEAAGAPATEPAAAVPG